LTTSPPRTDGCLPRHVLLAETRSPAPAPGPHPYHLRTAMRWLLSGQGAGALPTHPHPSEVTRPHKDTHTLFTAYAAHCRLLQLTMTRATNKNAKAQGDRGSHLVVTKCAFNSPVINKQGQDAASYQRSRWSGKSSWWGGSSRCPCRLGDQCCRQHGAGHGTRCHRLRIPGVQEVQSITYHAIRGSSVA
jgi:hypothetical protein